VLVSATALITSPAWKSEFIRGQSIVEERIALDRRDAVILDDTVGDELILLEAAPDHAGYFALFSFSATAGAK
jgi:hypothetical protein